VLIVVATATLIVLPLGWLITVAIARAPAALHEIQNSAAIARIGAMRIGAIDVGARVVEAGGDLAAWASGQALRAVGSVVRATLNMVVALFGLYFLLLAGPAAWSSVAKYLPFSPTGVHLLAERFRHVTEATLMGTALTAALQGSVVALGFAITGLPDAWFWGVVTALVSVLPVLGSALVWGPGAATLALQGRYGAALALLLIGGLVASNIDNVTRPLVNQRMSHLHPMTTLVGAFAGVGVMGLPGILFGPLAISYFFELVRLYASEYGPSAHSERRASGSSSGTPTAA
jgi:predicted PurR-regulated permease PerM